MTPALIDLPLFPLHVVLFPGSKLPIRIFEERYKRLFHDSLKHGGRLGIVLIKEGQEVGGSATPFDVGTTVVIESVDHHGDNLFLLVRGLQRFKIHQLEHDRPYLVGRIEPLDHPVAPPELEAAAHEIRDLFHQHLDGLRRVARAMWGGELQAPPLRAASGPQATLYDVAFRLPMEPTEKQSLLEEEDLARFASALRARLQTEIDFLTT